MEVDAKEGRRRAVMSALNPEKQKGRAEREVLLGKAILALCEDHLYENRLCEYRVNAAEVIEALEMAMYFFLDHTTGRKIADRFRELMYALPFSNQQPE